MGGEDSRGHAGVRGCCGNLSHWLMSLKNFLRILPSLFVRATKRNQKTRARQLPRTPRLGSAADRLAPSVARALLVA